MNYMYTMHCILDSSEWSGSNHGLHAVLCFVNACCLQGLL